MKVFQIRVSSKYLREKFIFLSLQVDLCILALISLNLSLIFQLGQSGSSLLVHLVLKFTTHSSVVLADLTENIGLVGLLFEGSSHHLFLEGLCLFLNLSLNVLFFVILHPLSLIFKNPLSFNFSFFC